MEESKEVQEEYKEIENVNEEVYPEVLRWIDYNREYIGDSLDDLLNLLTSRKEFGLKKYGRLLLTSDGRDNIQDCMEEIGDCMMYVQKAKMKGEDLSSVRDMLSILMLMVEQ